MADGNDQVAAIFAGGWVVDKERVGMVVVEVGKREMGGRSAVATKNYINSMGKVSTMTLKSREANVRDPRQKTCVGSLQWHGGPSQ